MLASVSWPAAPLTKNLVLAALKSLNIHIVSDIPDAATLSSQKFLQWSSYDEIDHELTHCHRNTTLASSYTIRKYLIRKHFLAQCVNAYTLKHPDSILRNAIPLTFEFELAFADELDDLMSDELWELSSLLSDQRRWWILKPGMADRGNEIRLFSNRESLEQILSSLEEDDEEDVTEDSTAVISQLRHFVIQEYFLYPLLLDPNECMPSRPDKLHGHKFHLRAYCVASGALTVFLYNRVLALFSSKPYAIPASEDDIDGPPADLAPHLTNSSLQTHRGDEGVRLFDELVGCHRLDCNGNLTEDVLTESLRLAIINHMGTILAEVFRAAAANPVHFQAIPNAFELFGVDFLVGQNATPENPEVILLELNSEPAIELTGPRLTWILEDMFNSIAAVCVRPFEEGAVALEKWDVGETKHHFVKCLQQNLNR